MFHQSQNNVITMTRADSGKFTIEMNIGSTAYPEIYKLKTGDKVYFGLSEYNSDFEHAILKKVFTGADLNTNGTLTIKLDSDDTVNLVPGTYFYEIKLEKVIHFEILENKTEVYTIVPRTKFVIC